MTAIGGLLLKIKNFKLLFDNVTLSFVIRIEIYFKFSNYNFKILHFLQMQEIDSIKNQFFKKENPPNCVPSLLI